MKSDGASRRAAQEHDGDPSPESAPAERAQPAQPRESTVHLVPHTHWDREWYLPFQRFRLKLVRLVDGLLDLMEADERYRFTLDGSAAGGWRPAWHASIRSR